MTELRECLSKELSFKQITQEMLTPPMIIDTFYERSFYYEWVIGLSCVFFGLVCIGLVMEIYRYLVARKSQIRERLPTIRSLKNRKSAQGTSMEKKPTVKDSTIAAGFHVRKTIPVKSVDKEPSIASTATTGFESRATTPVESVEKKSNDLHVAAGFNNRKTIPVKSTEKKPSDFAISTGFKGRETIPASLVQKTSTTKDLTVASGFDNRNTIPVKSAEKKSSDSTTAAEETRHK